MRVRMRCICVLRCAALRCVMFCVMIYLALRTVESFRSLFSFAHVCLSVFYLSIYYASATI